MQAVTFLLVSALLKLITSKYFNLQVTTIFTPPFPEGFMKNTQELRGLKTGQVTSGMGTIMAAPSSASP